MTLGSLCSGIGGLDLACEIWFGPTVWQAEVDRDASAVLARHWAVPNLGDLTAVDWSQVESVDAVCFGFPCQDLSYAGRGAGISEGTRSGLWYACWDAVRVLQPRVVVVENVAALLARRPGFDVVAGCMAADGYDFSWTCLRASDVGAPHRRDRIFIVAADSGRNGRFGSAQLDREPPTRFDGESGGHAARRVMEEVSSGPRHPRQTPADTDHGRRGEYDTGLRRLSESHPHDWGSYDPAIRRWERILGRPAPDPLDDRGRLNPTLVEWMMGYPEGWVDGLSRTAALRCLGNAVVPQQAAAALSFLLDKSELAA